MKKALILFSGGLDSTTCLAYARSQGFECFALSFNYGQKHSAELNAAKKIARELGIQHEIFEINIHQFRGSSLTDPQQIVPDFKPSSAIPSTYVPARNTIFLSIALGWAEVRNIKDIFIGVSAIDYSGYPDCRPEYIKAFQHLANLATKMGVEKGGIHIHTPLINLSKAETIQLGIKLDVNYKNTVSCYRADDEGKACGQCDSCTLRKKGFEEAKVPDQTIYYI